jgi:hypothetical protein
MTYLLLSNHPLATKLPKTTSAWVLLIFDLGLMALSSRRAARDETENDSCGASMICSIYLVNSLMQGTQHNVAKSYNRFKIRNFSRRVISSYLRYFVAFPINLKARQKKHICSIRGTLAPTTAYISLPELSSRRWRNSRSKLSSDLLTMTTNASQLALSLVCVSSMLLSAAIDASGT